MRKMLLLGLGLIAAQLTEARGPGASWKQKNSLCFVENKGQIKDQYGNSREDIQFRIEAKDMNVFIGNGQIHYQWYRADGSGVLSAGKRPVAPPQVTTYRMDVVLEGADPHAAVHTEEPQDFYEVFNLAGSNRQGIAHASRKIVYEHVYPGIDWVLYIKNTGNGSEVLKYDFIVHEGADAGKIRLKYLGASSLKLTAQGELQATTPLGTLTEAAPYSYASVAGKNTPVSSSYVLHDNILQFHTGSFSGNLTIDPTLEWGTYYGGYGFDLGTVLACDAAGNVYITGASWLSVDIATTGSYQYTNAGDFDAFLAKFDGAGNRIWATYYGGSSVDYAFGLTCDNHNNVYMSGQTLSTDGIASPGSYQSTKGSGSNADAFLVKFDSAGNRSWATYFGGTGDEGDNSGYCSYDPHGFIYLSGNTSSTSGIASGGFQNTFGGGVSDGYLAKFDTTGALVWSTYYGGSGDDKGEGVACDGIGNVYIGGHTNSTSGIATGSSHQPAIGGGYDDFVAGFDSTGARIWGTYYGGGDDEFTGGMHTVACDKFNNVYLSGHTTSTSGIASTGCYQPTLSSGGRDAFLVKFSTGGIRVWGTYYGGNGNDNGGAIACDAAGDVYWCGITASTDNMASAGAYQTTFGGGPSDSYIAKFTSAGSRVYGSYYGGSNLDEAYAVAFDNQGNAYISGGTGSSDGIATPNSFLTTYNGGVAVFLAKFCAGAVSSAMTGQDSICSNRSYTYAISPVPGANGYTWTLPAGWSGSSDSASIVVHPGANGGTITVQVIKCDTLVQSMNVYVWPENPAEITETGTTLSTVNSHTGYQWFFNGQPIQGATQATHEADQNGPYSVVVTNPGGCTDTSDVFDVSNATGISTLNPDNIKVAFYPNPAADYLYISASKAVDVRISSVDGALVLQQSKASKVDVSKLAAGMYLIRFTDNQGHTIKTGKFVKARK